MPSAGNIDQHESASPGPAQPAGAALVEVTQSAGQRSCGQLGGASGHQLIITPAGGPAQLIPMSAVAVMTPVTACP